VQTETIRVFAPAKINWMLTIRGRRPDGFHDLDTVFQALNWGDELICRRRRAPECRIFATRRGFRWVRTT
jgi:4-diphosphocytidyl-2-C-methyl-D-erythritol kinase